MEAIYLITPEFIKKHSILDANINDTLIKHTISDVQDTLLEPALGSVLYDKILKDVKAGTIGGDYKTLLDKKLYRVLIAGVVLLITENLVYKFNSKGVNKVKAQTEETVSFQDLMSLKKEKEKVLNVHLDSMKRYISANLDKFPEFSADSEEGIEAEDSMTDNYGIYFPEV